MSCVNTKSKEFKDLCTKLGISAESLEPIVHEYQNTIGDAYTFPSDVYILDKLGIGSNYVETTQAVADVYAEKYTEPLVFSDINTFEAEKKKALELFTERGVVTYVDNKGNYVLNVRTPLVQAEMKQILDSASRDKDGNLIAPNGSISHLNETQYALVRTEAFKKWFGDWINDPTNASKVVDENGEPLVVYHGTDTAFDTFDSSFKKHRVHKNNGFWFTTTSQKASKYGKTVIPTFLNIKNLGISDINQFSVFSEALENEERILSSSDYDGGKFTRLDKEGDNRGTIPTTQFVVKSSNQIKSATDNNGDFSNIDNSIYFNKTLDIVDILKGIRWSESPRRGVTLEHSLTRTERGSAYITVGESNNMSKAYDRETALKIIRDFNRLLINHGISPNAVRIVPFGNSFRLESNDSIPKDQSRLLSVRSIEHVLFFLESKIPGLNHRVVRENSPLLERLGIDPNAKAFFNNGTVYLIEGRFNLDIAIEECLHPLVNAIRLQNSRLFESLLKEAERDFPTLASEINKSYNEIDFASELVTQALSRAMSIEFKESGIGKSRLARFINRFLGYIKNLFGEVNIDSIRPTTTFRELALIINTEDAVFKINLEGREYHLGETALDRMLSFSRDSIKLDSATHIYTVNGKRIDMSVTEWVHRNNPIEKETGINLGYLEVSDMLGTTHDGIARDYLEDKLKTSYPNMTKLDIDTFANSLVRLRGVLDHKFGKGQYTIITDEPSLRVAGTILTPEGPKTIAGTMDMLVIDKDGNYHIFDFKTKRANEYKEISGKTLEGYEEQTSIYQDLIEANYPELKGKFGGNYLVLINLKYDTPRGSRSNEYGTVNYRLMPNGLVGIYTDTGLVPILTAQQTHGLGHYKAGEFLKIIPAEYKKSAEISSYQETQTQMTQETQSTSKGNQPSKPDKAKTERQKKIDEYLEKQVEFTKQIDALIGGTVLKASEVRAVAEKMVFWISDHITEMFKNPSVIKDYYGVEVDTNGLTRAELVNQIGVDRVIAKAKDKFSSTRFAKRSTNAKARLITANWNALMKLASDVFGSIEDFAIVSMEDGTSTVITDINADADNFNEPNDSATVAETEGDTQEHWQIESRTLDVLASMSQLVRQALMQCYIMEDKGKVDELGNPILEPKQDEFGINERVKVRDATNSILRWCQGSINYEHMVAKLENKAKSNPWINQVLDRLKDTSGKESDFQSQFFGVFNKHFQPYSIVIKEEGNFKTIQVNEMPALKEAINSVSVLYKMGEHHMFTPNGISSKYLKEYQETLKELAEARQSISNRQKKFSELNRESLVDNLAYISAILGYNTTKEMIDEALNEDTFKQMVDALNYIGTTLENNKNVKEYNPFDYKNKEASINGNLRRFLQPITDKLEDIAISSFYDSGKMYQSYVTPSYMTKLMQKFKLPENEFNDFIQEEYGNYKWFNTDGDITKRSSWRNVWLARMATEEGAREAFAHKVQLNFNKHNYMKNLSDTEYALSLFAEYFAYEVDAKNPDSTLAWFRVPILSNKPSSEFIRFYSYRGANYKTSITTGLKKIFDQELSRIQTVMMRNLDSKDPRFIKNFDKNGKTFMFLDFMNDYLNGKKKTFQIKGGEDVDVHSLINRKINGEKLSSVEEDKLNRAVSNIIYTTMQNRANSILAEWKESNIVKGAEKIANVGKDEATVLANLENFIWNDTFASMNIMQMTVTDIAYYKDAEDLQKRLAQIHAPGIRANASARDYGEWDSETKTFKPNTAKQVSDGKLRTFYLTDFDDFISNIVDNVNIVFNRRIKAAKTEQERVGLIALRDSLTSTEKDKKGNYKGAFLNINVADAQGYSSPTSYRKKALMFGKWSKEAEAVYQKLLKGEYTYSDLKVAFQPLKPFVYTQTTKSTGVGGAPMDTFKVPIQNKNSEYLLILADAILQSEGTGRPNLLRAIYQVMEESAKKNPTKGIDTVQFESTVKSGLMGRIDIKQFSNMEGGEAAAKMLIEQSIYKDGMYNETFVHEIAVEDYCIQQEVPEHFKNHEQAHGSQIRYIIPSDLETVDTNGNPVTYEVEGRQLTAEEFKAEYEATIAENIAQDIANLQTELGLDNIENKVERNIALSKILQREILSSPRYGVDLLQACSLDENGEFRIPLGDPIQSKRVEQLINSIIKNMINKQKIAGGPVVQVTNFGTSRELGIRFNSKEGGTLATRKEFEADEVLKSKYNSYEEYIDKNQAGIAYFEVFAPIYLNDIFEQFADENGTIDIKAIESTDSELLKMIGYRIPTEAKYSMAPLKIVGFLPREAGEGIMMPNDITLLTGSDYDVDKMYLMRKEIPVNRRKFSEIKTIALEKMGDKLSPQRKKDFLEILSTIHKRAKTSGGMNLASKGDRFTSMVARLYRSIAYSSDAPIKGRTYRNNKIVDMSYTVLTHETSAEQMLNPGGFDPQKRMGYMVAAYRNPANNYTWEQLNAMTIDELKDACYTDKNLSYVDTHIQFYKQNSAAGALIGMFAVHKVAHAVLEGDGFNMDIEEVCGSPFKIAGMEFSGRMEFDVKYDREGQLVGKVLGSLVASAADAVKDPVLNLMNINGSTANILNTLVRFGMPFGTAAMFLSQKIITDVLAKYNSDNITKYKSLSEVIDEVITKLEKDNGIDSNSNLQSEELTMDELVEGIKTNKPEIDYKVLKTFKAIQQLNGALKGMTYATRFNSISNAVGPLIIDNLTMEYKMSQFSDAIYDRNGNSVIFNDVLKRHPILEEFAEAPKIAEEAFGNMPSNSSGFREVLSRLAAKYPDLASTIYNDRKLLGKLSDFYQSYLVVASGVIKEDQLKNYIVGFPTWFIKQDFKAKYPDNALIQAIKPDINSKTGRAVLKIDLTGLDTQQKEVLSSAWIDLHKDNPDLSIRLFMYNFFRCGIGFSPKTFMGLVHTYVKERIPGYIEAFRSLPDASPELVIDQFIRNNMEEDKLVPTKKPKYSDKGNGIIEISGLDVSSMANVAYFKMKKVDGSYSLYKQSYKTEDFINYEEMPALGNNGEYLEISTSDIDNPIKMPAVQQNTSNRTITELKESDSELALPSPQLSDTEKEIVPKYTKEQKTNMILEALKQSSKVLTIEQAKSKWEEFRTKTLELKVALENSIKSYFAEQFTKLDIPYNSETIDEIYKEFC